MRRVTLVSLIGLTAVLLAFGPNASAGNRTFYFGKTAPNQTLLFDVVKTDQGAKFEPQFINFLVTCPATGDLIDAEFTFSGFKIPLQHGRFDLDLSDIFTKFDWAGQVKPDGATGTLLGGFPAYDLEGGLQDCNAGNLTWHAKALSSQTAAPQASSTPDMVIKVTKDASGKVDFSVTR